MDEDQTWSLVLWSPPASAQPSCKYRFCWQNWHHTLSRIQCQQQPSIPELHVWQLVMETSSLFSFFLVWNYINYQLQDIIATDPNTHGSMFVPIILGSDKTTVSVATGHTEYWPVYLSIGNIHINVRRAHRNGLVLLGFLAIPKGQCQECVNTTCTYSYISCEKICWQWRLSQLSAPITSYISREDPRLAQTRHDNSGSSALPGWPFSTRHIWTGTIHRGLPRTVPSSLYRARVVSKVSLVTSVHDPSWSRLPKVYCPLAQSWWRCDKAMSSTYRNARRRVRTWYSMGWVRSCWWYRGRFYLIIARYHRVTDFAIPIQPFTNDFPRADIHELISPDLLHQVIRGTFKDHLVTWVEQYLVITHGRTGANEILADIDAR